MTSWCGHPAWAQAGAAAKQATVSHRAAMKPSALVERDLIDGSAATPSSRAATVPAGDGVDSPIRTSRPPAAVQASPSSSVWSVTLPSPLRNTAGGTLTMPSSVRVEPAEESLPEITGTQKRRTSEASSSTIATSHSPECSVRCGV